MKGSSKTEIKSEVMFIMAGNMPLRIFLNRCFKGKHDILFGVRKEVLLSEIQVSNFNVNAEAAQQKICARH